VKAKAVGLGLTVGPQKAAEMLQPNGPSRRAISEWIRGKDISAPVQEAIILSREQLIATLWEGVSTGAQVVVAGFNDPKSRLGDKARALDVIARQFLLFAGEPTSRQETISTTTAPVDPEAERRLYRQMTWLLNASDDEVRAVLHDDPGLLELMRATAPALTEGPPDE
jgi:hypothetical protein